jgi:DnaK suppressor protein
LPEATPLTDAQLEELKSHLLRALQKLQKSMAATDEAAQPVELDQTAVGRLSRMDSLQNQAMSSNLQDRERARLAGILSALERIEEGTYGVCEECDDAIQYGRLMVFPEAATCAGCAG